MDSRFSKGRGSANRKRSRRRASLLFLLLVLLGGAISFLCLRSSDVFAVKTVATTATQHVTREEISRATSEALGQSLLRLSTGRIEEALLALPYVRSAAVHRSFPNSLDIVLEEYEPTARLQVGSGGIWLVADTGRILGRNDDPGASNLPLVKANAPLPLVAGELLPGELITALSVASLLQTEEIGGELPTVEFIAVSPAGELALRLAAGTEVRLGDSSELEQKLMVAAVIIERCSRDGQPPEYVDASVPDRVAVKGK